MKRNVPPESPWPLLLALLAILGSAFFPDSDRPAWLRHGAALALGGAWLCLLLIEERRRAREADERELRIRAEGRALGFNLLLGVIVLWIPLERAGLLPLTFPTLLGLLAATYLIGPWIVRRRYS